MMFGLYEIGQGLFNAEPTLGNEGFSMALEVRADLAFLVGPEADLGFAHEEESDLSFGQVDANVVEFAEEA